MNHNEDKLSGLEFKPWRAKYGGFPDYALLKDGKVIAVIEWINGPPYLDCSFIEETYIQLVKEGIEEVAKLTQEQIENT
jgi:predicted type IV restriction endonuclease